MSDVIIAGRGRCCDPFSALKEEIDMAVTIAMNARNIADEALTTASAISVNAMKYRGTVGTGGTIASLPTADPDNQGDTYIAVSPDTSPVTYETGDILISNGSVWTVVPSGDDPVDWSQILNTPTTLGGYGITDAVDLTETQAITGAKTVPLEATGTFSDQIASSNKVKNELDNYAPMVRTTGNQTIAGTKSFTAYQPLIIKDSNNWAGPSATYYLRPAMALKDVNDNTIVQFYPIHDANGTNHIQLDCSAYMDDGNGNYNVRKRAILDLQVSSSTGKCRLVILTPNGTTITIQDWVD